MLYQPLAFTPIALRHMVPGPYCTPEARDGSAMLLVGYWKDRCADHGSPGHCFKTAVKFHILDPNTNVATLIYQCTLGEPPCTDWYLGPFNRDCWQISGNQYCVESIGSTPYGDGLDPSNPSATLDTVLYYYPEDNPDDRHYIPLPL